MRFATALLLLSLLVPAATYAQVPLTSVATDTTLARLYATCDTFLTRCGQEGENKDRWLSHASMTLYEIEVFYWRSFHERAEQFEEICADIRTRFDGMYQQYRSVVYSGSWDIVDLEDSNRHEEVRRLLLEECGVDMPYGGRLRNR